MGTHPRSLVPRTVVAATCLGLVAVACDDSPTAPRGNPPDSITDLAPAVTVPGTDLELRVPVAVARPESEEAPGGLQLSAPPGVPETHQLESGLIVSAWSEAFAWWGNAGVLAHTKFLGNRIKVDVTATVSFLGQPLVSSLTRSTEDTYIYPLNVKDHAASSHISIEGECGHKASGGAQHRVWVQYVDLEWGWAQRPSNASPHSQPACDTHVVPVTEGSSGAGDQAPPGEIYTCWYRYYYDIETGQVLHTELLYCASS